ncbi:MAG: aspartate aminotransferase family protein [Sphingobacteriales bacterium]|nr:MAG: aspartate aminotransferase family protein [Sphingobacteriales bacterium]
MKYWKKLSHTEQDARITAALKQNVDYRNNVSLGIPASVLDSTVFYEQAPFLKDAPLLRAYIQNPNHIGCHTLGESETFFKGTQDIEREVIELLSTDVLHAPAGSCDGYIAAGGTEANIQAAWIYRNYFIRDHGARPEEVALLGSADTHYSIAKSGNLLSLDMYLTPVDEHTRQILPEALDNILAEAKSAGVKYMIVISNMGTTMFGSIDQPGLYVQYLQAHGLEFRLHIDGAFGGFIYPISNPQSGIDFSNEHVSSVTLDAHKMLQAPYGTGIFLVRKGLMEYVYTKEAKYVNGMDITLSGSRSGTNAIAVWMILVTYGPFGWLEKINKLLYRTDWCCRQLDSLGVTYYRHPKMNIITIKAAHMPQAIAHKYGLVPDSHHAPQWYKIVVMDHVELDYLEAFIKDLTAGSGKNG